MQNPIAATLNNRFIGLSRLFYFVVVVKQIAFAR